MASETKLWEEIVKSGIMISLVHPCACWLTILAQKAGERCTGRACTDNEVFRHNFRYHCSFPRPLWEY